MCQASETFTRISLKDVAYIQTALTILISLATMQKAGLVVEFPLGRDNVIVTTGDQVLMVRSSVSHRISELKGVNVATSGKSFLTSDRAPTGGPVNIELLHRRLKHVNFDVIKDIIKQNVVD